MGVSSILVGAMPIPISAWKLIPMYNAQHIFYLLLPGATPVLIRAGLSWCYSARSGWGKRLEDTSLFEIRLGISLMLLYLAIFIFAEIAFRKSRTKATWQAKPSRL
jgi:hypothetical protein